MSLKSNFELMADYNQWMNKSVYIAASKLSADELLNDRGAFFGSIIGTLNHILVGDTIWLKRFADHPSRLRTLDYVRTLDTPKALDTILYPEFKDLESTRIKMDEVVLDFAHELTDEVLVSNLSYCNTKGEPFNKDLATLFSIFSITKPTTVGKLLLFLAKQVLRLVLLICWPKFQMRKRYRVLPRFHGRLDKA